MDNEAPIHKNDTRARASGKLDHAVRWAVAAVLAMGFLCSTAEQVVAEGPGSSVGLTAQAVFDAVAQAAPQASDGLSGSFNNTASALADPISSASASAVNPSMWNLSDITTASALGVKETTPVTGTLMLNADRTYELEIDGNPVIEMGVWFQDRNKILLFAQNILEQILALEADIAGVVGEPVELTPAQSKGGVSINKKSGIMTISSKARLNAFFPQSNVLLRLSTATKIKGTRVP